MSSSITNTEWPRNVELPVRDLIDRFFTLLCTNEPNVGNILADEVFTPEASARFGGKWFNASQELRLCREHSWVDTQERHDTVFSAYCYDAEGGDLLLRCETYLKLRNGNEMTTDFIAGMKFHEPQSSAPRLQSYWTLWDSAPLRNALNDSST